jgi:ParB family chromosome partitioning protein
LAEEKIVYISKDKLFIPDYNPRIARDPEKIKSLAENIKQAGIAIPLTVRKVDNDDKYEVIDGSERLLAAEQIGLDVYPCIIKNVSLTEAKKLALAVNIEREELSEIEKAKAIKRLLKDGTFKTKKEAAIFLGWSENFLNTKLEEIEEIEKKIEIKELVTEYPGLNIKVAETLHDLKIKPTIEEIEIIKNIPKQEQQIFIEKLQKVGDVKKAVEKFYKEKEEQIKKPLRIRAPSGFQYELSYSQDDNSLLIFKLERDTLVNQIKIPVSDLKFLIENIKKYLELR